MTTVKNIYDYINSIAPFDTQEKWDNSGHLVGEFRKAVTTVVMSLDVTKEVVEFAREVGAQLILSHHPVIFSPLKRLDSDSVVYMLASSGIACISAHTNLDRADGGINTNLAELLGLRDCSMLDCGCVVGHLEAVMSMDDFAEYVSDMLDTAGIRYTDTDKLISKVAVGGGNCEEFLDEALEKADCFVTGDMKYHTMLDAQQQGRAVISAGHFETENKPFLMLKSKLGHIFSDVSFIEAPRENPVKTVV